MIEPDLATHIASHLQISFNDHQNQNKHKSELISLQVLRKQSPAPNASPKPNSERWHGYQATGDLHDHDLLDRIPNPITTL